MPARELVIISDGRRVAGLPDHIAGAPVRIVDWEDVGRLSRVGDAALLIDVDLRDVAKVKTVKDNLPIRTGNQCRIVVVERGSHLSEVQANGLSASDLLKRPFDMRELRQVLQRHFPNLQPISKARKESDRAPKDAPGATSINQAATALEGIFTTLTPGGTVQIEEITDAGDQVIDAIGDVGLAQWLDTVRSYHESTFQHCLIVTGIITAFGHKHGMRRSDVLILTMAGLLHDIGKSQIPLEILDKPGELTAKEFAVIKGHPTIGYEYLRTQDDVPLTILNAVRYHHEYLDGSGYPDGLQGQKIDDLTRILTVCDVFGALIERRAYKAPIAPDVAFDILMKMAEDGKIESALVRALANGVSL